MIKYKFWKTSEPYIYGETPEQYKARKKDKLTICLFNKYCLTFNLFWRISKTYFIELKGCIKNGKH